MHLLAVVFVGGIIALKKICSTLLSSLHPALYFFSPCFPFPFARKFFIAEQMHVSNPNLSFREITLAKSANANVGLIILP
jgi:hypothetical protein